MTFICSHLLEELGKVSFAFAVSLACHFSVFSSNPPYDFRLKSVKH